MNVFELFASIEVDDQGYIRALDNLERKTERSSREMQSTFSRRLGRMQTSLNRFGESAQRFGGVLSRRVTAPIAAAGTAALVAADRTSRAADAIDKGSQSAGLSAERYQTLRFAFEQSGISAQQFDLSLTSLNRRLGLAAQGNQTYADAYERLGVATRDANGELRSSGDVFDDLVVALSNMESSAEQAATASIVFGDDVGKRLVPVLNQGADGLADLERQARDAGVVLSGESVDALVEYRDEMNVARRAIGNAAAEVVVAFLPALQDIVQVVRDRVVPAVERFATRIEGLIGWFSSLSRGTQSFVLYVVTAFAVGGPLLIAVAQVTTAFSNLLGVVRLLPAAVAVLTGPAGALTALAVLLGGALYRSLTTHDRQMQNYRTTVEDVANTVGTANDKASLRGRLDELAARLTDEEQNGWKEWADSAITNADRVIDAQRAVARSIAVQIAAEEIREIERREDALRRTNEELARYSEIQLWAAQGYLNVRNDLEQAKAVVPPEVDPDDVAEIQVLKAELQDTLDLLDQANLTKRQVNMQIAPLLVNRDRFQQDLDNLNADVDAVIDGIMARFDEAGSDGLDVDVETVPDAGAGGTDDDPTGLMALGEEPIDVTIRPRVEGGVEIPVPEPSVGGEGQALPRHPTLPRSQPPTAGVGADPVPLPTPTPIAEERPGPADPEATGYSKAVADLGNKAEQAGQQIDVAGDAASKTGKQFSGADAPVRAYISKLKNSESALTRLAGSGLELAANTFPTLTNAVGALIQGGPLAAFGQVILDLLVETDGFKQLLGLVTRLMEPFVRALEPLAQALVKVVSALEPLFSVAVALFEAGLQPLVWLLENVVVPVFTFVANAIRRAYNALFGWIFGRADPIETGGSSDSGTARPDYSDSGAFVQVDEETGEARISPTGGFVIGGVTAERGSIAFYEQEISALRRFYNNTTDPEERRLALDAIERREKRIREIERENEPEEEPGRVEELRNEIADLEEQRDSATDEDEIRRLNREIARKRQELNRLLGLGEPPPPEAPDAPSRPPTSAGVEDNEPDLVWSEQQALEDARTDFGSAGQSVQLAVATPLIQAANKFQEAADTLTGGVGNNIYQTHAMAMQNHATWLQRMIEEGFNIKLATENEQIEVSLPRYI